jgi:hypothetical protein
VSLLVASDLDRTLIYSRGAVPAPGADVPPLVAVERYRDEDASWMTAAAAQRLAMLAGDVLVVPVTTRTPEQWQRIQLPGPPSRFAITANGGILLTDGEVDRPWQRAVAAELARVTPLADVWEHAAHACRPEWTSALRNAHGMFVYAVLDRPRLPWAFVAETTAWAEERGWRVSLQGRKLYWVPRSLTKSAALREVAARVGSTSVVAAGDSLLDADLLEHADRGIVARHGELVASGWSAPHVAVTAASGVAAGAEIVDWFVAAAARR